MSGKRLQVFATNRARRAAAALVPGVAIEEAVEATILDGRLVRDHAAGRGGWLVLGDGWQARVEKRPSPVGAGRYWSVRSVEALPGSRRAGGQAVSRTDAPGTRRAFLSGMSVPG
jgi:hypothetical protein